MPGYEIINGTAHALSPGRAAALAERPACTPSDVDAERDRRIDAGFAFAGRRYQSRPDDRENIAGAGQLAFRAVMGGAQPGDLLWSGRRDPATGEPVPFVWIAEDNGLVPMDAQTAVAFSDAAAQAKSALIFAAKTLKDRIRGGETVTDCTAPQHWPA